MSEPTSAVSPRESRAARAFAAALTVVVCFSSLVACNSKKRLSEPIPECTEYLEKTRACFGDRAATRVETMIAKVPATFAELESRQKLCAERTETIRRVCQ